jgi:uncharacterized caspase-like protein
MTSLAHGFTELQWLVLQQALQDAQGSRIMFVDTCHASGAYNSRLVKDAADANIVVFSATDKDTEAQETSKLGHGVFTYCIPRVLSFLGVNQSTIPSARRVKTAMANCLVARHHPGTVVRKLAADSDGAALTI